MGAGAVGGYFGGMLSRSGADVTFVARGQQLEAISSHGLRVESAEAGSFTVHPPVVERLDGSWKAALVLLCVKAYDNETAIEVIGPAVGEATTVLTFQNGIGAGDRLAEAFGPERVLLGAAYIEASRTGPGVVAQSGPCRVVFGEEDGAVSERVTSIQDAFARAGVEADVSHDILKDLWTKLVFICALSGMTCIARATMTEVMDTPQSAELTRQVMEEAAAAARASGVELEDDVVESNLTYFQRFKRELVSSMYQDLEAGRPLEVGVLNGAVSRIGNELGVPTPVNDFITSCLAVANQRARSGRA